MDKQNGNNFSNNSFDRIVDIVIRLIILFLILGWCVNILRPFILILIWSAVIAIAIYPLYKSITKLFGGRKVLATVVLTILFLSLLIIPAIFITESLYDGVNSIRELYHEGQPLIPPPGERAAHWPSFTKPILDLWKLASENLEAAISKYSEQLKSIGKWILAAFTGIGKGLLQFIVSIIIAGVMLAYSADLADGAKKLFRRLAGENGDNFISITIATIRNVVKGILGVAVIQSAIAGIGFFVAGVPFAGLWTVACLILSIVQIGAGPVIIPVIIYMFSVASTLTAVLLTIWLGLALVSDNILKPILLGRGAPAPMLIIFLGSIGGFITSGFIGLFLGAVILSIGYKLLTTWLEGKTE